MVNYKAVAEFFEDVVCYEGRTDVQSHVGLMNIHNQNINELATNAFGGGVLVRSSSDVDEYEKLIYVYGGDGYEELAEKHFTFGAGHFFVVLDAAGQKVYCWAIGV